MEADQPYTWKARAKGDLQLRRQIDLRDKNERLSRLAQQQ